MLFWSHQFDVDLKMTFTRLIYTGISTYRSFVNPHPLQHHYRRMLGIDMRVNIFWAAGRDAINAHVLLEKYGLIVFQTCWKSI